MVSIVLVTYNRAKRLKLSVEDILQQTFRDFELIICDDCSPDNTEAVCKEFAARDSRVRYFRHAQNMQMPGNLNFGIQQARHEYVAILHDGDRFRKDLIEQWYNAISRHDNCGLVFNSLGDSDGDDRIVNVVQDFEEGVVKKETLLHSNYFRRKNLSSPIYGEVMVRKSLVEKYGYFKPEYSFYADVDLWMEILHNHDAYYCADTLIKTPYKCFQPQEFADDIVKFNVFLLDMSLKHRIRAFRGQSLKLGAEMVYFYFLVNWHLTYILLLVTKNFSFRYFLTCRKQLYKYFYVMPIWAAFLISYPLLRPALRNLISTKPLPEADDRLQSVSEFMFSR